MNEKKFQISARDTAAEMDRITKSVIEGKVNVNVGTMTISKFKVLLAAYRLQLDESKISGKPLVNPLVDMS